MASKGPLPPASSAFKGHVKFEDVSFAYATSTEGSCPTGPLVLSKVNLEVKPGEAVVLMGPSGCGKSTVRVFLVNHHIICVCLFFVILCVDGSFIARSL